MSWEQLEALAAAHRRRDSEILLLMRVAAQGDKDAVKNLFEKLRK